MSADAADTEQSGRYGPLPTTPTVIPAPRPEQPAADVIPLQRLADDADSRAARRSRPPAEVDLPAAAVDPGEAEEFLRLFHAENPEAGPVGPRVEAVREEIARTGTYVHTGD